MSRLTVLLALVSLPCWSDISMRIGPGQTYHTVSAAVQSQLPLKEDLRIYVEMQSLTYSNNDVVIPNTNWGGHNVIISGAKTVPEITGYVAGEYDYEWDGELMQPTALNIQTPTGGVEGTFSPASGNWRAQFKDHLGSTRLTMDNNGAILEASKYFAYGKESQYIQPPNKVAREKYTGKEWDTEGQTSVDPGISLYYFGARYYDPDIGMWISPDPRRQHYSPYMYGGDDPVNRFDPDGLTDVYYLKGDTWSPKWRKTLVSDDDFQSRMSKSEGAFSEKGYSTKFDGLTQQSLEAALADPEVKYIYILGHQFSDVAGMASEGGGRFRAQDLNVSNSDPDVKVTSAGCYSKNYQQSWIEKIAGYIGLNTGTINSKPAAASLSKAANADAAAAVPKADLDN